LNRRLFASKVANLNGILVPLGKDEPGGKKVLPCVLRQCRDITTEPQCCALNPSDMARKRTGERESIPKTRLHLHFSALRRGR